MIVILMGVSGSGKTVVGRQLAEQLGWPFVEGDDLHPEDNVRKMAAGIPLDDDDRAPWLAALRRRIESHLEAGGNAVIACSALKQRYRQALRQGDGRIVFVYLRGDPALLRERLGRRRGHFFDPNLLDSQFAALEEPDDAVTVDVAATPEAIAREVRDRLTAIRFT